MPCYDGRERDAAVALDRRFNALTALMCGVMSTDRRALDFALEWCTHHQLADQYRKHVRYDWQDKRIQAELDACDAVLDRAYPVLCEKSI